MVFTRLPDICILLTLHSDLLMQVVLFWNDLIKPLGHPHPFRQIKIHPPFHKNCVAHKRNGNRYKPDHQNILTIRQNYFRFSAIFHGNKLKKIYQGFYGIKLFVTCFSLCILVIFSFSVKLN